MFAIPEALDRAVTSIRLLQTTEIDQLIQLKKCYFCIMLCPEFADKAYKEYGFKYENLVQKENKQGIKMTLKCDKYGVNILSPKFKLNGPITFQARYVYILDNSNQSFLEIFAQFAKPFEDPSTYIINLSSDDMYINKKKFNTSDAWQVIYHNHGSLSTTKFDIDITLKLDKTPMGTSIAPLHNDEELTDFELRGEDGTIRVHRAVLAAASPVLRRMLCGTWKETAEGHVDVPGTSKLTLQQFKDFVYLHTLPDTGLEQLVLLASYYMMPDLEQKCVKKLVRTLTALNAVAVLEFAANNKLTNLLLAILKHFEKGKLPVKAVQAYMSKDKESDEKELEE